MATRDPARLKQRRQANPAPWMLGAAKRRARDQGLAFTIGVGDIKVPTHCPVLGIPLRCAEGLKDDNSPTLDRVKPHLGYVPSNIVVVSWRANRIKTDATPAELRLIADFYSEDQAHAS